MNKEEMKNYLRQYRKSMAKAERLRDAARQFSACAEDINREIDECEKLSRSIEKLIRSHGNYLEREVLIYRYIYGDTNERIAENMRYSPRQIQRIANRAVIGLCDHTSVK